MSKSNVYILSASQISAQEPFCAASDFLPIGSRGMVPCKEPDYKSFISPMVLRRMSSVLRRSIAVTKDVLKKAGIECPDAIITGTGLGCISDTESFLLKMVKEGETMLNPSKFITSTPNTIGSQIAIHLGCNGFNSTHLHDGLAFENAMLESFLLLSRGELSNVLLCAADQLTETMYSLLDRAGIWKDLPSSEASVAFMLSSNSHNAVARIDDVVISRNNHLRELERMLLQHNLSWEDIDTIITSDFGGMESNEFAFLPQGKRILTYKQYSGQFLTASAIGTYIACGMLESNKAQKMLLVNYCRNTYSFTLFSSLCTN